MRNFPSAYPGKRMARIAVRLEDGREITHFQKTRKGDPEDPLSDEELIVKFDELAGSVLHNDVLNDLRQAVLFGTTLPGAAPLAAV